MRLRRLTTGTNTPQIIPFFLHFLCPLFGEGLNKVSSILFVILSLVFLILFVLLSPPFSG